MNRAINLITGHRIAVLTRFLGVSAVLISFCCCDAKAESSVTLYGVIDIGFNYESYKLGNDPNIFNNPSSSYGQFGMAAGQQTGSRWGLKGVEDLGNGISANFVLEQSVIANTGAESSSKPQSTIGLSSASFGAIDFGRRAAPSTYALYGVDPFGNAFGQATLDSSIGTAFMRLSNMIMYRSPSFSGWSAAAGYSFNTGLSNYFGSTKQSSGSFGTSNKFRALSTGLRYAKGSLLVGASFDVFFPNTDLQGEPDYTTVKTWNIGGTYDFEVIKLHAAYGQNIDGIADGSNVLANAGTSGGVTNTQGGMFFRPGARTQSWMLGLTLPIFGSGSVFTSLQQMIPGGTFDQSKTNTMTVASIGYTYGLSERTNLYLYYSYMDQSAMLSGTSSQALGLGIRHFF